MTRCLHKITHCTASGATIHESRIKNTRIKNQDFVVWDLWKLWIGGLVDVGVAVRTNIHSAVCTALGKVQ